MVRRLRLREADVLASVSQLDQTELASDLISRYFPFTTGGGGLPQSVPVPQ